MLSIWWIFELFKLFRAMSIVAVVYFAIFILEPFFASQHIERLQELFISFFFFQKISWDFIYRQIEKCRSTWYIGIKTERKVSLFILKWHCRLTAHSKTVMFSCVNKQTHITFLFSQRPRNGANKVDKGRHTCHKFCTKRFLYFRMPFSKTW